MRIALYIEDGREQIVLTPESKTEKGILDKIHDGSRKLSLLRGSFYACHGGWTRQRSDDDSTMIVLDPMPPETPSPAPSAFPTMAEELAKDAGLTFVDEANAAGPYNAIWNIIHNDKLTGRSARDTAYDVLIELGYTPVPSDG
jgi:hypothetical protein